MQTYSSTSEKADVSKILCKLEFLLCILLCKLLNHLEWMGMVRTRPKTAFLWNTFYNTLENKWENNEGGEQCHKINRSPYTLKTENPLFFWNMVGSEEFGGGLSSSLNS